MCRQQYNLAQKKIEKFEPTLINFRLKSIRIEIFKKKKLNKKVDLL